MGRIAIAALAFAAAAVMTGAGSASAAGEVHTWKATGVKVHIEENGDVVTVCDTKANGQAARIDVSVGNSEHVRYSATAKKKGDCATRRASQHGDYDLPEHRTIRIEYRGQGNGFSYHSFVND